MPFQQALQQNTKKLCDLSVFDNWLIKSPAQRRVNIQQSRLNDIHLYQTADSFYHAGVSNAPIRGAEFKSVISTGM